MPIVRPFRGILYDPEVVGPLERVVAPPYDVISRDEQDRLYDASPHNVIRLDLSRDEDRYAAACRTYREWIVAGVLKRDVEPALYAYSQSWTLDDGSERTRWGFFTRLHVEDFSARKVLPHEKTLDAAKSDRLALQHACRANLSSIFGIFSAPGWSLEKVLGASVRATPRVDISDLAGVRHRFWRVTDPAVHGVLAGALAERAVYIADGHHRYETAIRYRDEMRAETGLTDGDQPFDYVLAFLSNMDEPGLVVLPTHRLLRELPETGELLASRLRERFAVEEIPVAAGGEEALISRLRAAPAGERRIAVALRGHDRYLVLGARDGDHDAELSGSTALRHLDVTLLHGLVLEGPGSLLRLDAHHEVHAGNLVYVKDDREALRRVAVGEMAAAFLMNATRLDEVRAVCEEGETMPEKSTYFYPKLLTGLVFNSVAD